MTIEQRIHESLRGLPAAKRRQVANELLAHVADLRRELFAEGLEPEEVEQQVWQRFGDPADICQPLVHVHRPGLTWGRALLGLIIAFAIAVTFTAISEFVTGPVTLSVVPGWPRLAMGLLYLFFWLVGGIWVGQETQRPVRDAIRSWIVFFVPALPFLLTRADFARLPLTWVWFYPVGTEFFYYKAPIDRAFIWLLLAACFFFGFWLGRLAQKHKRIFI